MDRDTEKLSDLLWHLMGSNVDSIGDATLDVISGETTIGQLEAGKEAIEIVRYLVSYEDGPCRYDHHGYCQEHPGGFRTVSAPGWDDGEWKDERPECMVAASRAIVNRVDNT